MGLDVRNKVVSINQKHNRKVLTNPKRLPHRYKLDGMLCYALLVRYQQKNGDNDGNPLVYSLKEMHGYRFDEQSKSILSKIMDETISKFLKKVNFEIIVKIPSSCDIPDDICNRILEISGVCFPVVSPLAKKNNQEALVEFKAYSGINTQEILKQSLNEPVRLAV